MAAALLRNHEQAHNRLNIISGAYIVPNKDQAMYTKEDNGRSSSTPAM